MLAENLDAFLSDFGVDVVFSTATFKGILDTPDDLIGGGLAVSTDYQLTVKSSSISTLEELDELAIGSSTYKVKAIRKLSDGSFSAVSLSKVVS